LNFDVLEESEEIPGNIKKLAEEREQLRKHKKFREADEIRKKIQELGYSIEDSENNVKIKKYEETNFSNRWRWVYRQPSGPEAAGGGL
jgi:hypothetical protein